MRTRKELIYLNIKDLSQEEIETLGDMELNACDNCGEIEQSEKLHWIDGEGYYNDEICKVLLASDITAICDDCYDNRDANLAHCGSCEKYFIAFQNKDKNVDNNICPHCDSMNWVLGCIDDADFQCFACKGKSDCQLEAYQDCQYNPANSPDV